MIVEAFASGLAVIGSSSGELPHTIGDAGIVVDEANRRGWIEALEDVLSSEALRRELGSRGLERARTKFALPVIARQHLGFFDSLLHGVQPSEA
jgi:glycosyltransferase involved in cell wall biosynthesis